jgi:hypothetical protein
MLVLCPRDATMFKHDVVPVPPELRPSSWARHGERRYAAIFRTLDKRGVYRMGTNKRQEPSQDPGGLGGFKLKPGPQGTKHWHRSAWCAQADDWVTTQWGEATWDKIPVADAGKADWWANK